MWLRGTQVKTGLKWASPINAAFRTETDHARRDDASDRRHGAPGKLASTRRMTSVR